MIIKKFLGKTEEEAVEAAKKELGSCVVIMNVKTVKPKGMKALFRPKMIEVTVALEEESDVKRPPSREGIPQRPGPCSREDGRYPAGEAPCGLRRIPWRRGRPSRGSWTISRTCW